jgi:methionyl-tRNA formyltransferase
MRVLVLGSLVPMTARTIWRLLAAGHEIAELWIGENTSGVWRRRDRRLRWLAPTWSVGAATRRFGITVRCVGPLRGNPELIEAACSPKIDAVLSACFPYIVPDAMLEFYAGRALNLHPALLPRYRGPCPMPAILYDERLDASGVTLHLMTSRLDAGDIVSQQPVGWPADGWYRTWEADLAEAFGHLAADALPRFLADRLPATPQSGPRHYVRRLPAEALLIDSRLNERRVRWLAGSLGRVTPLKVSASCGEVPVNHVLRTCGAATGRPPRVGWRHAECDVCDARVALRRWDGVQRRTERLRELVGLARRPMAA